MTSARDKPIRRCERRPLAAPPVSQRAGLVVAAAKVDGAAGAATPPSPSNTATAAIIVRPKR